MFKAGDRVRVNEKYEVNTDHGRTGVVVAYEVRFPFIPVDMDSGNDLGITLPNLYLAEELDLLDADDDTRL